MQRDVIYFISVILVDRINVSEGYSLKKRKIEKAAIIRDTRLSLNTVFLASF